MALDLGALLRLRGSIRGTLESVAATGATGSAGLAEAYETSRTAVISLLTDDLRDEVERLFPARSLEQSDDLLEQANIRAEARAHLGRLAGWIDGVIEQLQYEGRLRAEAEAYARERVKAERSIGFKGRPNIEQGP